MLSGVLIFVFFAGALGALNGLGHKPYMGWSSWSLSAITNQPVYGRYWLTEQRVQEQSDALAKYLQKSGYDYINIDSFWAADPTKEVDPYGRWTTNLTRFPSGFKGMADYVHNNGQKIGIYLNPGLARAAVDQDTPILNTNCTAKDIALPGCGNYFCDTYPVNFSHHCAQPYFDSFAAQLAEWGVDFVKLDAVSPGSDTNKYDNRYDVEAWAKALVNSGRDIWFTISWHINVTFAPYWVEYANAWRVEDDVECYCNTFTAWYSVVRRFTDVQAWLPYLPKEGGWNDFDSIDVGNGPLSGLTDYERQSYISFWAISAVPMYTGNDLTALDSFGLYLLTHPDIIAINQMGIPAHPTTATASSELQVWYLKGTNGTVVGLFNLGSTTSPISFLWSDVGLSVSSTYTVTDIWNQTAIGSFTGKFMSEPLPTHATQLLLLN